MGATWMSHIYKYSPLGPTVVYIKCYKMFIKILIVIKIKLIDNIFTNIFKAKKPFLQRNISLICLAGQIIFSVPSMHRATLGNLAYDKTCKYFFVDRL